MRRIDWHAYVFALLAGGAAASLSACFSSGESDCSKYPGPECHASTGTSSSTGTGGMPPADCSGPPSATNLKDACAVFVKAGATNGSGTMESPFGTLTEALANVGNKGKVYACNAGMFSEAVTISSKVDVYGGFGCTSSWTVPPATLTKAQMSQLNGPAGEVALTIGAGAADTLVSGFAITAPSPTDMTMGGSSIAVAVADVAATLESCVVTASDAANGIAGTAPTGSAQVGAPAPPIQEPSMTADACVLPSAVAGGAAGMTMCGAVNTSGGVGGKGGGAAGSTGNDGATGGAAANASEADGGSGGGLGGAGQTATSPCKQGVDGAPGSPGAAGTGGTLKNDMLLLTGVVNGDTTDGQAGTPGEGGGGGGGALQGMFCGSTSSPVVGPGASGGGGGAGGCAGLAGGGGKAGGSSIAILSLGPNLTLTGVTLATGNGGAGGSGTLGQNGATGGGGAMGGAASSIAGSSPGCQGGNGGMGGAGGPGGGGRGGYSVGVAYAKTPTMVPSINSPGGAAGGKGTGAGSSNDGAAGLAGSWCDFSKSPVTCTM